MILKHILLPTTQLQFTRGFSSYGLLQKTLVQKIQSSSSKNQTFLTLKESSDFFLRWLKTDQKTLINEYEEKILSRIELPKGVSLQRAKVAGLHTLKFVNRGENSKDAIDSVIETPTVMLHGHCSSGVFYHRNFHEMSKNIKSLYTVDFPDVGLSDTFPSIYFPSNGKKLKSKPKYDFKLNQKTGEYKIKHDYAKNKEIVESVKDYYIDSLEQWRIEQNIEKFNLVAHSFGGYLSFFYSLRYPDRVNKLILVSPAGVERSVFSLNNKANEDSSSPVVSSSEGNPTGIKTSLDGYTFGLVDTKDTTSNNYYRNEFTPWMISTFGFGLTKILGPFGIQLIAKYLSLRYARGVVFYNSRAREQREKVIDDEKKEGGEVLQKEKANEVDDMELVHDEEQSANDAELVKLFVKYTILMFYQNQKSYFYLQCLLNNQILAFDPILDHVGASQSQLKPLETVDTSSEKESVPSSTLQNDLLLLYGQYDWMSSTAGFNLMRQHNKKTDVISDFEIVEDAGHNVFLDNSDKFNSDVLNFLKE